ncbi:MAG: apolipoprotein N-acyltransferase [Microbacterium sp. SCN 70-27]|uniref:apolipoprotein N-acyltransferase n=1 Tax=unclassified Microbacterium TaxID=2609290 RepID=UPI00086EA416|nr:MULTISPECIES: apolipoprotein N-acyltransferase [unclassified Microbacterium]ODT27975.1 MAG: apolipoprotein N-acyltransferase [Microbacterium sp. SCN 70-27]
MPDRPRPILPLWIASIAAAVGGLALMTAFPELAWWGAVFVAVPLALVSLVGRRVGGALLVGLIFGVALFFPTLSFTARYLGPVPWIALSLLEALLTAAMAVPIALAYRIVPRIAPGTWGRLVALPALVAGLWVAREELLGTFPYGGFPWARLGVTQASSPFAESLSWVGMSGVSFLIAFGCAAAIEAARLGRLRDVRTVIPAAVALIALVALPQFPTTDAGTMRVGAVQGNGPAGYFDERAAYDVLRAQLAATVPIEGEDLDVLLWPEGGVDADPTRNASVAAALDGLAERVGAPLLVSAVTQRGEQYFNSSLVWEAGARNPTQTYDKRHPVPFGEYVPDRWLYRMFAPDLIDLIQREYTPGTAQPVVDVGGVKVGLAICFDVIYDDVARDGARGGAEVFMFQTNNADFRGTSENLQQLAFARVRAIEAGRSVVNLSTVGTSQVIAPDGATIDALPADEPGAMVTAVPLRTGLTPAMAAGDAITLTLGWGSVVALVLVGVLSRRRRPGTTETSAPEESQEPTFGGSSTR